MFDPDCPDTAAALDVVRNPARYTHLPAATTAAWMALKQARGQQVRCATLPRVTHARAAAADLVTRIHNRHAQLMGQAPTGGDAA